MPDCFWTQSTHYFLYPPYNILVSAFPTQKLLIPRSAKLVFVSLDQAKVRKKIWAKAAYSCGYLPWKISCSIVPKLQNENLNSSLPFVDINNLLPGIDCYPPAWPLHKIVQICKFESTASNICEGCKKPHFWNLINLDVSCDNNNLQRYQI